MAISAGLFGHAAQRLTSSSSSLFAPAIRQSVHSSRSTTSPLLSLRSGFSTAGARRQPLLNSRLHQYRSSFRQHAFNSQNRSQARQLSFPAFPTIIPEKYKITGFIVRFIISTFFGVLAIGGVILLHDALTYTERHVDRVPTHLLALNPRRGGPKNLPIIERDLADQEDEFTASLVDKPHLVIVGGGWGVSSMITCCIISNLLIYSEYGRQLGRRGPQGSSCWTVQRHLDLA
jgi:hypothetical protein